VPELPEVEIARRCLERWLGNGRIVRAEAEKTRIFRGAERSGFEALRGKLTRAERRGKNLLLTFEHGRALLAHLGMTGKWVRREGPSERYSRARLFLKSGEVIHFVDPRMFGRLEPVASRQLHALPVVRALGLDPLVDGLSSKQLSRALEGSKQELKVALMDQGRVAGLGNIHAAEALYRARLHPARLPGTLGPKDWRALAQGIRATFRLALRDGDVEEIEYVEEPGSENPFWVYGRKGERCRRCGARFESFPQGGRTTYYCPGCQRMPKGER
jgi:formamidopyrimidine-DNA glycosylase